MAGIQQKLSKGQQDEVVLIFRNKLLTWTLIGFALLTGLTGFSLWGIMNRVEHKMEDLVAKQFEEPRIQKVVSDVAAERASSLMEKQIAPEAAKFKSDIENKLNELQEIVAKTRYLEAESLKNKQSIQEVLDALERSLKESQVANNRLNEISADIVQMQKSVATIQYYQIKGASTFPNPYMKEMFAALNDLVSVTIPDPVERSKFIMELQGPQEPNNK